MANNFWNQKNIILLGLDVCCRNLAAIGGTAVATQLKRSAIFPSACYVTIDYIVHAK